MKFLFLLFLWVVVFFATGAYHGMQGIASCDPAQGQTALKAFLLIGPAGGAAGFVIALFTSHYGLIINAMALPVAAVIWASIAADWGARLCV